MASNVAATSSDAPSRSRPNLPNLPFRRMSMPTVPSLDTLSSSPMSEKMPLSRPQYSPRKSNRVSRPPSIAAPKQRQSRESVSTNMSASATSPAPVVQPDTRAKRWRIIVEFHATELSYLEGLELIYSHFLVPLIASLDSATPILTRTELNSVFSNFIDIWNLHRSLFSSLSSFIEDAKNQDSSGLAIVLSCHFPYLSLYTPFITAYPTAMATITRLQSENAAFAKFLKEKEEDPVCRRLGLQAWLLTIVQRCPRYLLMLKDLIDSTSPQEQEYADLVNVHALLSKITLSLNTSLHTHAQTMALVALQKATLNLPFPLIAAGRTLLKRGTLLSEGRRTEHREFLLFSDCLIWLSPGNSSIQRVVEPYQNKSNVKPVRPALGPRSRSKSDAELPKIRAIFSDSNIPKVNDIPDGERTWIYKGQINILDLEVVVSQQGKTLFGHGFDILSPERSFTVYTGTLSARDEWVSAIRGARSSLMMSLSAIHANTTLTSSASNEHVRRALQALPYSPGSEEWGSVRRGKVDHFLPPIWVPDHKTQNCMRCARTFNWRRRRHHCRLCGRCVCATCSEKTFFISDSNVQRKASKSARACNACYETVFPVISTSGSSASELSTVDDSSLSSLPVWKTTKQTDLSVSALKLLASQTELDQSILTEEESRATTSRENSRASTSSLNTVVQDDPFISQTPSRNKRFSTPVLAIQSPAITANSEGLEFPRKGRSSTHTLIREASDEGTQPLDETIAKLQQILRNG